MLDNQVLDSWVLASIQEFGPTRWPWTADEIQFVRDHLALLGYEGVAQALGRSEEAVKIAQVRYQIPAPSKQPGYLTGNQAARALGTDIHAIMKLAARGIFQMERLPGKRGILRISLMRMYMWAINPAHFVYYNVSRMQDKHLQRLCILARERWGDEWVRIGEAEKYTGITSSAMNQRLRRGMYAAGDVIDWGNWWIKRSALQHLVIRPCKTIPAGINYYSPRADAFLRRAHAQGLPYQQIGRMAKMSPFMVVKRLSQMGVIEAPKYMRIILTGAKHADL